MRSFYALFGFILAAAATGCASVNTYDMAQVQGQLTQTLQKTEEVLQKAQSDFQEKNTLIQNLKQSDNPNFDAAESKLDHSLEVMKVSLDGIAGKRKAMMEQNGRIAALAYSHPQIHSEEPEYPKVSDAVRDFQSAARDVNAAISDYTRESNTLADLVAQKKLFYNFDVKDFQLRVQQAIKSAQASNDTMKKEIDHSQALLNNWSRPDAKKASEDIYGEMVKTARSYTEKAQRLPGYSREMHTVTMGDAKVSTLDKNWPEVQKVIDGMDRTVLELRELREKFESQVDLFRNPSKRVK
jgi:hypothetical protein